VDIVCRLLEGRTLDVGLLCGLATLGGVCRLGTTFWGLGEEGLRLDGVKEGPRNEEVENPFSARDNRSRRRAAEVESNLDDNCVRCWLARAAQGEVRQEVADTRWLGFTTNNLVTRSLPWVDTLAQVSVGKTRWQRRIEAEVSSSVSSLKGGCPERRRKRRAPAAHMSE